jgi:hypothetical protein
LRGGSPQGTPVLRTLSEATDPKKSANEKTNPIFQQPIWRAEAKRRRAASVEQQSALAAKLHYLPSSLFNLSVCILALRAGYLCHFGSASRAAAQRKWRAKTRTTANEKTNPIIR